MHEKEILIPMILADYSMKNALYDLHSLFDTGSLHSSTRSISDPRE